MGSALDIAGLLALLEAGGTVLLPTQRAVRGLRDRYDRQQRALNLRAWEPPRILTWTAWIDSLWTPLTTGGHDDRVLLNRLQEQVLWAEVIARSPHGASLTSASRHELSAMARSALELAAAHVRPDQLPRDLQRTADSFNARAFAGWYSDFAAHCRRESLLARAVLEHALEEHIHAGRCILPPELHLAGFERLTPAQDSLLRALSAAGTSVRRYALQHPERYEGLHISIHEGTPQDELRWAVRWIRHRFERDRQPEHTFALVLPDPAAERPALDPLLREILAPELERADADLSSTPWHFTSGPKLASLPIIQNALLLLQWTQSDLPIEEVSRLLFSPFFEHTDSLEFRARFEISRLRDTRLLRPELSIQQVLRMAHDFKPNGAATGLALNELRAVARFTGISSRLTGTASHGEWAELVRSILRAARWPGDRPLTPAEFNATEAWDSLLDLVATLDLHGQRRSYSDFLQILAREARAMEAHESTDGALLQIGRIADFEGCFYDSVLVLHATDRSLPAPEQPHPLLGWALQQKHSLPGTTPSAAHERSCDGLRSLASRSRDLLLLAPEQDEAGEIRLTPLAAELAFDPVRASLLPAEPETPVVVADCIPDTEPLPPLPTTEVKGGARVLELQAACGFRAFASFRLFAKTPEVPHLGMDARTLGSVLHHAMQHLWSEVRTYAALNSLSGAEQHAAVQRAVDQAFLEKAQTPADPWTDTYLQVLRQRLVRLIATWLPRELEREPFEVSATENSQHVAVGPISLDLRIDRLDKVDDGVVYVDYKTAYDLKTDQWLGERPDAPQLPLYTLTADPDAVRGIAFARMRPGKDMGWISLQDRTGIFPQKRNQAPHDLAAEIAFWRQELTHLAQDFASGNALVDPKSPPHTCKHCEHRLLCRINPAALMDPAEAEPYPEVPRG